MKLISLTLLIVNATLSCAVMAEENTDFVVTAGVGYGYGSQYSGADESRSSIVPYFRLQKGIWFADSYSGLGFDLSWDNGVYFTQALGYSLGRAEKDSDWRSGSEKLKGMGTIKSAVNSSSTLGWQLGPRLALEANVTAPLSVSQGLSYRAGARYKIWSGSQDTLVLSSDAHFGDARNNNLRYGVSRTQSQHSGYQSYRATAGLYSVDAKLSWMHNFSDNWWSYTECTWTHLTDNVNRSPIVFRKNGADVSVSVLYSF